jgi:hypothetical protein
VPYFLPYFLPEFPPDENVYLSTNGRVCSSHIA